jgi:hypothetical protein
MYLWEFDLKLHKVHMSGRGLEARAKRHVREKSLSVVGGADALVVLREVEAFYLAETEYDEEDGADVTTERVEIVLVFRKSQVHHILMCAEGEPA